MDSRLDELIQQSGVHSADVEVLSSWEDLINKLPVSAMFSSRRVFLLEYSSASRWKEAELGSLESILQNHTNLFIAFERAKPDRRQALFKILAKVCNTHELMALKGAQLQNWLVSKAMELGAHTVESRAAAEIIAITGSDMGLLTRELEKLINYSPTIDINSVRDLVPVQAEGNIFKLVDSVVTGKRGEALKTAAELLTANSATPYILQMLARQYRLLFRICFHKARGVGSDQIAGMLKLHPYAFQNLWRQATELSALDSARSLQHIAEADYQFKTGSPNPLALIQTLLIRLSEKSTKEQKK